MYYQTLTSREPQVSERSAKHNGYNASCLPAIGDLLSLPSAAVECPRDRQEGPPRQKGKNKPAAAAWQLLPPVIRKMPCGKATLALVIGFAALVAARPQDDMDQTNQDDPAGLPFLQFKNGGVRVNFAGYHAEAGLGGLLTGSRADGGLRASAGTASGAHASAGLGGLLGGDNANAGGGLHARAGLGNGGPEAAAGLGGMLDGTSRSLAQGGLYAGASPGVLSVQKRKIDRTNVQAIARSEPKGGVQIGKDATAEASAVAEVKDSEKTVGKEVNAVQESVQPFAVGAGLYGGVYGGNSGAPARKTIEKVKISNGKIDVVEKTVQDQPAPEYGEVPAGVDRRPSHSRWYWRKRFRLAPARKTVIYQTQSESDAQPAPSAAAGGVAGGYAAYGGAGAGADVTYGANTYKTSTLFDDIFNIPISTLTAVNQLLKNKVG